MKHARLLIVLSIGLLLGGISGRGHAQSAEDCLICHGDTSLSTERRGRKVSLHVAGSTLQKSAHAALSCADCHAGYDPASLPHRAKPARVDCASCHGDTSDAHRFHARLMNGNGGTDAAGLACVTCHGSHGVQPIAREAGAQRSAAVHALCARCHESIVKQYEASEHGKASAESVKGAPECLGCHERPLSASRAGENAAQAKLVQERLCLSCHLDDPDIRARIAPGAGFIRAYETSVHGTALLAGDARAPSCVDCHGSHEMRHGTDSEARISRQRLPETCAKCHGEVARIYEASVHGQALHKGSGETPVCTTCHGEHEILLHTDPRAAVAPGNVSAQVCSPCHSSVRLSQKYGLSSDRFKTFNDSYHGLAISGGSVTVANCASCHGSHDIRPSRDPLSSVHKANLPGTCGKCHPGANESFAKGAVHVVMEAGSEPILYGIAVAYIVLIITTVGAMLAHNLLHFVRASRRRRSVEGEAAAEGEEGRVYLRMSRLERVQHALLLSSFVILVVTGFMLRYPEAWWVVALRRLWSGTFELRSLMHRIAGTVMVAASLFHIGYIVFTARGRRLVLDLLPRRRDLGDLAAALKHNLGLSREEPAFHRFSYVEKVEYWSLVWGTFLMTATGFVMWFENTFIGLMTKTGYDVARTIHFYEAWLATLAIIVWHIYFVVFNPDVYPMSRVWITGTLTEAEMRREHPLELADIRRESLALPEAAPSLAGAAGGRAPVAVVASEAREDREGVDAPMSGSPGRPEVPRPHSPAGGPSQGPAPGEPPEGKVPEGAARKPRSVTAPRRR